MAYEVVASNKLGVMLYEKLDLSRYSPEELEEFGLLISSIVVQHIGLIQYQGNGLTDYDFTDRDLGQLCDSASVLIAGIDNAGVSDYTDELKKILKVIIRLDILSAKSNSSRLSLQTQVFKELKALEQVNNLRKFPNLL